MHDGKFVDMLYHLTIGQTPDSIEGVLDVQQYRIARFVCIAAMTSTKLTQPQRMHISNWTYEVLDKIPTTEESNSSKSSKSENGFDRYANEEIRRYEGLVSTDENAKRNRVEVPCFPVSLEIPAGGYRGVGCPPNGPQLRKNNEGSGAPGLSSAKIKFIGGGAGRSEEMYPQECSVCNPKHRKES